MMVNHQSKIQMGPVTGKQEDKDAKTVLNA
jgi:hypothetical protein